jgi:hypothetical protein
VGGQRPALWSGLILESRLRAKGQEIPESRVAEVESKPGEY